MSCRVSESSEGGYGNQKLRQFGVKKGILRGQTLLAVLEILSGQATILRDMVSLEFRGDTPFGKLG